MKHPETFLITLLSITALAVGGCGGPARTQTTTSTSTEHPTTGGEVHHTSTETTEVQSDGSQTVESTQTTQTSTPAPH